MVGGRGRARRGTFRERCCKKTLHKPNGMHRGDDISPKVGFISSTRVNTLQPTALIAIIRGVNIIIIWPDSFKCHAIVSRGVLCLSLSNLTGASRRARPRPPGGLRNGVSAICRAAEVLQLLSSPHGKLGSASTIPTWTQQGSL